MHLVNFFFLPTTLQGSTVDQWEVVCVGRSAAARRVALTDGIWNCMHLVKSYDKNFIECMTLVFSK